MVIKTPFFRLTIALLLKKVSLAFFMAVSKLAFSVRTNLWLKRKVFMKDTRAADEASYSRLGESILNSECGFAELKTGTKQTHQVRFALHRSKTTRKEKK